MSVSLYEHGSKHSIIAIVSQEALSVQKIVYTLCIIGGAILCDITVFSLFSMLKSTIVRFLFCSAVVYGISCQWLIALCSMVLLTISHQAGGSELILCYFVASVIQYSKIRMVRTAFSRWVLIMGGYFLLEILGYCSIATVGYGECMGHIAIVGASFLVYTITKG